MRLTKRPCKICRKWFSPNLRIKERQMTCGDPQCKKEWHRRKCAEWNEKNSVYFKGNYLKNKIIAINEDKQNLKDKDNISPPRFNLKLPRQEIQEVIGPQQLVIIEYIIQLFARRLKELINSNSL